MPWRTITEDDLRASITGPEDKTIRTAALADGQADPYLSVKAQVCGLFRSAIRSAAGNRLDPDEATLPEGAIFHAVAKIRFRLLTRFASDLLDDDRRTENKEAESWLKEVRRGYEKIEQPDDAPGETHSPEIEVSGDVPDREFTRRKQSGL